jgi:enoyl-CoA hydratase/carnithine racemase
VSARWLHRCCEAHRAIQSFQLLLSGVPNMSYQTIVVEVKGAVGVITINRPKALNALNGQTSVEMMQALDGFDASDEVRAIIITGNEKAFAAGADVKEMKDFSKAEAHSADFLKHWDHIGVIRKPIIAAVSGFCLGGGFEVALVISSSHLTRRNLHCRKSRLAFSPAWGARSG